MNQKTIDSMQDHFDVHPLLFQRSLEYAKNENELFDILDSLPDYPITWDNEKRKWVQMEDEVSFLTCFLDPRARLYPFLKVFPQNTKNH